MPVPQILYLPREDVVRLADLAHERAIVSNRSGQIRATVQKLLGRRDGEREQGDARPQDQETDLQIGIHLSFSVAPPFRWIIRAPSRTFQLRSTDPR